VAGREALIRLSNDPRFKQLLSYIDQLAPHTDALCGGAADTDVEIIAQQRLLRISREIQRQVKKAQDNETAFRLSC